MKLLYIAGYGRSGTTILDNVLAQVDGFTSVGEMRYLWDRGIRDNWTCGCGQRFSDCPFWRRTLEAAVGGSSAELAPRMLRYRNPLKRLSANIHQLGVSDRGSSTTLSRADYLRTLGRVYEAVVGQTNARLIIDSSKWASYGHQLAEISGVDLYVVHLVRDPRAVAFSWKKNKSYDPHLKQSVPIHRYPVARTVLEWVVWNWLVDRLCHSIPDRSMVVRYEDFSLKPSQTLERIFDMVGEPQAKVPLVDDTHVHLSGNHCVAGNPVRFQRGLTEIAPDDAWRREFSIGEMWMVQLLARPWMARYGYPVSRSAARSRISRPNLTLPASAEDGK